MSRRHTSWFNLTHSSTKIGGVRHKFRYISWRTAQWFLGVCTNQLLSFWCLCVWSIVKLCQRMRFYSSVSNFLELVRLEFNFIFGYMTNFFIIDDDIRKSSHEHPLISIDSFLHELAVSGRVNAVFPSSSCEVTFISKFIVIKSQ